MRKGRRGNRNNRERGLNDKVSVKVWGRRQNGNPGRSRFLADKLWKCCCRPAPIPRVSVSRRLWSPCWAGLSTLLVRTSRKEAFGFPSEGRKSFFLFLNVHCFWNWMETNTEREGGKGGTDKHTTCFCQAVCTLKPIFFWANNTLEQSECFSGSFWGFS